MALLRCRSVVLVFLLLFSEDANAFVATRKAVAFYDDSACTTTPLSLQVSNISTNCTEQSCSSIVFGHNLYYYKTTCLGMATDTHEYIAAAFTGTRHITMDQFRHQNCSIYTQTHALQDSKRCVLFAVDSISLASNASAIATILVDGSINVQFFPATNCSGPSPSSSSLDKQQVAAHQCYQASTFYISTDTSSSSVGDEASSDTSVQPQAWTDSSAQNLRSTTFVSLLVVSVALILSIVGFVVWKWRSTKHKLQLARTNANDSVAMLEPDDMVYLSKPVSGRTFLPQNSTCSTFREQMTVRSLAPALSSFGSNYQHSGQTFVPGSSNTNLILQETTLKRPWEDDFVVAARIPRDKVVVVQLLSRGGFGVVYAGLYNGRRVAIKMLLPETRRNISHVVDLLTEVKMMASMEHPHIVEFIGVAWDSLTNMCVVSELMAGGDLKALLSDYEEQKEPMGFTRDKLKIALHIAHALTYMHSMDPPIIHRDLKSKNVLLNERLEAKLTDFGTSRERVNESMTGGVGTCLWMAPEVMIGDRYDDKADMFSFGVVLSELDTHASPYWHVKDPNDSSRQMPEPAILQLVATGKLHVKFSKEALQAVVELGQVCVSLDPTARPTASEALYKMHSILTHDAEKGGA